MPDQVTFAAQKREVFGKAVKRLRRSGIIPGNIYGHNRPSVPVQLNGHDFELFLRRHAATTLLRLTLDGGGAPETALIRHVQHEPVTGAIQHVDFLHVMLSESIKARIPVRLEGESPAVRNRDGILLQLIDAVEVEARPTDLPPALTLDVSGLAEIKSTLYVRDIPLPRGVKLLTDPDEPVVKVEPARVIAEAVPSAAEAAPTEAAPTAEAAAPAEEEG
ncbi:MAG: 50S ribosomal protein L25 [Ktedonobacterales bacterium]